VRLPEHNTTNPCLHHRSRRKTCAPTTATAADLHLDKASSRLVLYLVLTDPQVLRLLNRRTGTSKLATTHPTTPTHSRRLLASAASNSSSLTPRLRLNNSSARHSPRLLHLRVMVKVLRPLDRTTAHQFHSNNALLLSARDLGTRTTVMASGHFSARSTRTAQASSPRTNFAARLSTGTTQLSTLTPSR
jgi:hypothetical protein